MTLALLCPGQGTQHAGMFALTAAAPEAAPVFAAATALLDEDPRRLVRRADAATLHGNRMAQVLCGTQQLAAFLALRGALGGGWSWPATASARCPPGAAPGCCRRNGCYR